MWRLDNAHTSFIKAQLDENSILFNGKDPSLQNYSITWPNCLNYISLNIRGRITEQARISFQANTKLSRLPFRSHIPYRAYYSFTYFCIYRRFVRLKLKLPRFYDTHNILLNS